MRWAILCVRARSWLAGHRLRARVASDVFGTSAARYLSWSGSGERLFAKMRDSDRYRRCEGGGRKGRVHTPTEKTEIAEDVACLASES